MALTQTGIARAPQPAGLYEVLDLILDKGLMVDVYVRLSLVGIEILTLDVRIVIASVDTYLRYAEAVGPQHSQRGRQGGAPRHNQSAGTRRCSRQDRRSTARRGRIVVSGLQKRWGRTN